MVEDMTTKINDAKVVIDFLKSNIFCQFGVPKALIGDQGSHFCNRVMSSLLSKYGVVYRVVTTYHLQTNSQVKYSIEKSRKYCKRWSIPTGRTRANSLRTLYGHIKLHTELRWGCLPTEYKAVKQCNLAYDQTDNQRKLQLQELEELRLEAYENSRIYKQKILRKEFRVDQKVLLFNSRLKLIAGKLHSDGMNHLLSLTSNTNTKRDREPLADGTDFAG
ncbi:hypothetical protein CR513_57929, partial [Mucuna pruriens]